MEVKKNSEVDGDKVKSSMTIIGLSYVAALTLAVFTFGQVNIEEDKDEHAAKDVDIQQWKVRLKKMSHRHRHHRKKWKFKLLQNHLKR